MINNVTLLAKVAKEFKVPAVLTAVETESFSGYIWPQLLDIFPGQPVVERTSMNSWDDAGFRKTIEATGRKNILMTGLWTELAEEVAEMHFPAPLASAVVATTVQFICALFLIAGLFTRINAALLVAVLGGAILQNLLSGHDLQLAILYTLLVLTLVLMGGGRFSLDAWLERRWNPNHNTLA
jgi:uncharacterized membrane protein YphA (DoxX/SURF4 family)